MSSFEEAAFDAGVSPTPRRNYLAETMLRNELRRNLEAAMPVEKLRSRLLRSVSLLPFMRSSEVETAPE